MLEENDNSILHDGENHPCVHKAYKYVKRYISDIYLLATLVETLASVSLSGNRAAQICLGTLSRITKGMPVGERYVFGLAWMIREIEELNNE